MLYAKEAIEKAVLAGIDIIRDNWIDWKTGIANVADASDDEASRARRDRKSVV